MPAVTSIAIIIAMIPLGLVLMTSIAFAVGAAVWPSQQVLVQELPAVEGLARVDVICLDKTGTLTFGDIAFDADASPRRGRRLAGRPGVVRRGAGRRRHRPQHGEGHPVRGS